MTLDILFALVAFCFVGVITPGPNNLMLMASGANFGFRRTVPHMFGIGIGMLYAPERGAVLRARLQARIAEQRRGPVPEAIDPIV